MYIGEGVEGCDWEVGCRGQESRDEGAGENVGRDDGVRGGGEETGRWRDGCCEEEESGWWWHSYSYSYNYGYRYR